MPDTPPAQEMIARSQILNAAASIGMVGSGADSASRIMGLLCNPKVTAREVAAVVGKEPALTARVLRVANSAYYGLSRSVSSIERALLLLGLDAIRGIAAAACLDRAVSHAGKRSPLDLRVLVRHSIATAIAAESIARARHAELSSDAFIAGLLHNLGTAVQLQIDPHGISQVVIERGAGSTADLRALERKHMSVGHEECAGVVFEEWRLPEALVAACRHHHDPLSSPKPQRTLVAVVHAGGNLALESGHTYPLEPAPPERNPLVGALAGVSDEEQDAIVGELPNRVADLSSGLLGG